MFNKEQTQINQIETNQNTPATVELLSALKLGNYPFRVLHCTL